MTQQEINELKEELKGRYSESFIERYAVIAQFGERKRLAAADMRKVELALREVAHHAKVVPDAGEAIIGGVYDRWADEIQVFAHRIMEHSEACEKLADEISQFLEAEPVA